MSQSKEEKEKFARFRKNMKKVYCQYDNDGNGILDKDEIRVFIDDLRTGLFLDKCDDTQFKQIWKILDSDGGGDVDWKEFSRNMKKTFPIIAEPSEKMMKKIMSIWNDFDVDGSGYWERNEWILFLKLMCDKLGVKRCQEWQIDYIVSIFDLNCDGLVDVMEFKIGYRNLMAILLKNKRLKTKKLAQALCDPDICFVPINEKKLQNIIELKEGIFDEEETSVAADMAYFVREYQREDLKRIEEALVRRREQNAHQDVGYKLDKMTEFNKKTAHGIIPLDTILVSHTAKENYEDRNLNEDEKFELEMIRERNSNESSKNLSDPGSSDDDIDKFRDEYNEEKKKKLEKRRELQKARKRKIRLKTKTDSEADENDGSQSIDKDNRYHTGHSSHSGLVSPNDNTKNIKLKKNLSYCSDVSVRQNLEEQSDAHNFHNKYKKEIEFNCVDDILDGYTCGKFADLVSSLVNLGKYYIENAHKMLNTLDIVKTYSENCLKGITGMILPTLGFHNKSQDDIFFELKDELLKFSEEKALIKDLKNETAWKRVKSYIERNYELDETFSHKSSELSKILSKIKLHNMLSNPEYHNKSVFKKNENYLFEKNHNNSSTYANFNNMSAYDIELKHFMNSQNAKTRKGKFSLIYNDGTKSNPKLNIPKIFKSSPRKYEKSQTERSSWAHAERSNVNLRTQLFRTNNSGHGTRAKHYSSGYFSDKKDFTPNYKKDFDLNLIKTQTMDTNHALNTNDFNFSKPSIPKLGELRKSSNISHFTTSPRVELDNVFSIQDKFKMTESFNRNTLRDAFQGKPMASVTDLRFDINNNQTRFKERANQSKSRVTNQKFFIENTMSRNTPFKRSYNESVNEYYKG